MVLVLFVVGLAFIFGIWEKVGVYIGMVMFVFFYLVYFLWLGIFVVGLVEGNYFIVNKNLVELVVLGVLVYFFIGYLWGLSVFFNL